MEFVPSLDQLVTHPSLDKAHVSVLEAIEFLGHCTTKEIAAATAKSFSAANRSINQLMAVGLVAKQSEARPSGGRHVVYSVVDSLLLKVERQLLEAAAVNGMEPSELLVEAISSFVDTGREPRSAFDDTSLAAA